MKIMKKAISMFLVAATIALSVVPAYAASSSTSGYMSVNFISIMSISAGLSIDSNGKATCSGLVTPSDDAYTADITVSLQEYDNGWTTIKSWTASGEGYDGAYASAKYYVSNGKYRVKSTAKIYDSAGTLLETQSINSAEKTY